MFKYAIEKLQAGESVSIRPKGNSMRGKVDSGDIILIEPCRSEDLIPGDVVLVKVRGIIYLHLIKAYKLSKGEVSFQIGNNIGGINGWVGPNAIYGKAIKIEKP